MAPHIIFLVPRVFQPSFVDLGPKLGVLQKAKWESSKKAKIRPGGRKTARRAAKRPPTGKQKLSRGASGYEGLMVPLSRVYPSQKKGGFIGVSEKNAEAQTTFSESRTERGKPSICAAKLGLEGFPTLHTQCPVWSPVCWNFLKTICDFTFLKGGL